MCIHNFDRLSVCATSGNQLEYAQSSKNLIVLQYFCEIVALSLDRPQWNEKQVYCELDTI